MIKLIVTTSTEICEKLKEKYELKFDLNNSNNLVEIFRKDWIIAVKTSFEKPKETINYLIDTFSADFYINLDFAISTSSEHISWDIIMPNVFFEYNTEIDNTEINWGNRDSFMNEPFFIENYDVQNDYDFEKFGLSIGWINLTKKELEISEETKEKIILAYEPDIIEWYAYDIIKELAKKELLKSTYFIKIIKNSEISSKEELVNNWVWILDFLMSTLNKVDSDAEKNLFD